MPGRPLPRDFADPAVLVTVPTQSVVIFFKDVSKASLLLGRIEGRGPDIGHRNFFHVELPGNQVDVAESPQPGVDPVIETKGRKFAWQGAVMRREKLHVVKLIPVAGGPRQKRQK